MLDEIKAELNSGTIDVCKMKKPRVICKGNLDIPRCRMPQFNEDSLRNYIEYKKKKGFIIENTAIKANQLVPTQNELNGKYIIGMIESAKQGIFKPCAESIVVAQDPRTKIFSIIDGHHRGVACQLTGNSTQEVILIHDKAQTILNELESFPGIKKIDLSDKEAKNNTILMAVTNNKTNLVPNISNPIQTGIKVGFFRGFSRLIETAFIQSGVNKTTSKFIGVCFFLNAQFAYNLITSLESNDANEALHETYVLSILMLCLELGKAFMNIFIEMLEDKKILQQTYGNFARLACILVPLLMLSFTAANDAIISIDLLVELTTSVLTEFSVETLGNKCLNIYRNNFN